MTEGRRILVVEDDPKTASQVVESLTTGGYRVDLAANGSDALSCGHSADYDVLTIDRMLPDFDGIAVVQHLRQHGIATPALIISALGDIDDRVRGLRAGCDDYLVKPFAFAELLARVEALVVAATPWWERPCYASVTSRWISCCGERAGTGGRSNCTVESSSFWNIWFATKAVSFPGQHHRRLCGTGTPQDRRSAGVPAHPYRSGRGVLPSCLLLTGLRN
jgi:DNA-binding response OmpR family regulator